MFIPIISQAPGIPADQFYSVVGRKLAVNLKSGHVLQDQHLM